MTNEEAIKLLVNARYADDLQGNEDLTTAHLMAIKALEQEPILDKIRAEIENHRRKTMYIDTYDLVGDCLDIIDKCSRKRGQNDMCKRR